MSINYDIHKTTIVNHYLEIESEPELPGVVVLVDYYNHEF